MSRSARSIGDPTDEMLRGLAAYLPRFQASDFEFGRWEPPAVDDGVTSLGFYVLSDEAVAFIESAYTLGWVFDFDWMKWASTEEAKRLHRDRDLLAAADGKQISKLLTAIVRNDRFGEGSLAEAYESGLLTAILGRVTVLADGASKPR